MNQTIILELASIRSHIVSQAIRATDPLVRAHLMAIEDRLKTLTDKIVRHVFDEED